MNEMVKKIMALRKKGLSWKEVGEKMGISPSTAWTWYYDTDEGSKKEVIKNKREVVKKIEVMRKDGYTWEKIGDKLGVSPSTVWIWYDEFLEMKEGEFVKEFVKPYLEDKGHDMLTRQDMEASKCTEFNMQIDIISFDKMNNVYYYSEVKISTENHRLQTAIGQLFSHKFCNGFSPHTIKYQIVFPENCKSDNCFSNEFREYLIKQMDIKIIFV